MSYEDSEDASLDRMVETTRKARLEYEKRRMKRFRITDPAWFWGLEAGGILWAYLHAFVVPPIVEPNLVFALEVGFVTFINCLCHIRCNK